MDLFRSKSIRTALAGLLVAKAFHEKVTIIFEQAGDGAYMLAIEPRHRLDRLLPVQVLPAGKLTFFFAGHVPSYLFGVTLRHGRLGSQLLQILEITRRLYDFQWLPITKMMALRAAPKRIALGKD